MLRNLCLLGLFATVLGARHSSYGWVFKVDDYGLKYAHMSTIETLPNNGLAHACQASATKEGAPDQSIWFQVGTVTQSKAAFGRAKVVVSASSGLPVWGPVLHFYQGVLYLFYSDSGPWWSQNHLVGGDIKLIKSLDLGKSWGNASTILAFNGGGQYDGAAKVTANKLAVLPNGEWALPFWQETPKASTEHGQLGAWNNGSCAGVLLSSDHGESWTPHGCIGNHYLIENTVAPIDSSGTVLMLGRSGGSPLYSSISRDFGRSWTPSAPTTLPNPNSKVFMYARPDFSLVLAYNPSTHGRKPLALAESKDGGKKWTTAVKFDDGSKEYEYPTTTQINSTSYTTYSAPTSLGIKWASHTLG